MNQIEMKPNRALFIRLLKQAFGLDKPKACFKKSNK